MGAPAGIDWQQVDVSVAGTGQPPGIRMAGFRQRVETAIDIAMVPHPAVTLLVDLTASGMSVGAESSAGSVVVGLSPGPVRFAAAAPGEVLQVRLSPVAAVGLIGDPKIIGGGVTQLSDLWGSYAHLLSEQLRALPSWTQRFTLMTRALAARASSGAQAAPEVAYAWSQTARRCGLVRIETLAEETGWSRQRLWSRFRTQIGLSPKQAARLVRFDRAARLLSTGIAPADVAQRTGYSDQSHLHRQVRAVAGTTPSAVAAAPWLGIDDVAWPTPRLLVP